MTDNLTQTIKLQQLASNPQNSSWVFASAGSGKTKVLTDRVLRLLLSNVTPDKILCLTFTKVAAAEMQNRINNELAKWVLLDDTALNQKLFDLSGSKASSNDLKKARILFAEILDAESKIKIQTIHSFCQSLIKIFPFEAKVRPNFEVLEDAQEKLFLQKSRKEVLKKSAQNSQLRQLVSTINSKLHEATFDELIEDLLSKKEQLTILKENYFGIDGVIAEIFKKFGVQENEDENQIISEFLQKIDLNKSAKIANQLDESTSSRNLESSEKIKKFLKNPSAKNFNIYASAFITDENKPRKFYDKIAQDADFIAFVSTEITLIKQFQERLNSYKICNSTALLLQFVDQIL